MSKDPITDFQPVTMGETERIDIAVTRSGAILIEAIDMNGSMIITSSTRIITWADKIDDLIEALQRAKAQAS